MDDEPCIILKRGKKRLLCREYDMQPIAHNPLPLLGIAAGLLAKKGIKKLAAGAAAAAAGSFIGKKLANSESPTLPEGVRHVVTDSLDVANPPKDAWIMREALR